MIGAIVGMVLATGTAQATPKGLALGLQLGEPLAATVAYRWNDEMTARLSQGWSFGQQRFHMSADYLYTVTEIESDESMGLSYPVYVGAGLRLRAFGTLSTPSEERGNFGFRFPIGAAVSPDHIPLEVYFEMAPVWVVAPISHGGFDGGIGGRLFF